MSNLSDINYLGDTIDTGTPLQAQEKPARIRVYPLLGLAMILTSAALSCGLAVYLLGRG